MMVVEASDECSLVVGDEIFAVNNSIGAAPESAAVLAALLTGEGPHSISINRVVEGNGTNGADGAEATTANDPAVETAAGTGGDEGVAKPATAVADGEPVGGAAAEEEREEEEEEEEEEEGEEEESIAGPSFQPAQVVRDIQVCHH